MRKQIGLVALSTVLIACVAFSGVASAQTSSVTVYFFYSPLCSICEQVKPLVESAAAQTGAKLVEYNVADTSGGQGIAAANGVSGTPTIIINGGQRLVGAVSEQQIIAAIQTAGGSNVAKAAVTPTATPTPTPTPAVVKAAVVKTPVVKAAVVKTPVVKAAVVKTPEPVKAVVKTQPPIEVVTATQTPTTSTQTVPEFSLLGLGAPALLIGAIYLFLRRR